MDVNELVENKNRIQRKIEILNEISNFSYSSDIVLVNEMKEDYRAQLQEVIEKEKRIERRTERIEKMAFGTYKFLIIGGGILSLYFLYVLLSHQKDTLLGNDTFLFILCVFYVLFTILNISVLTESKTKYAIAIILLIPGVAFITRLLFGYDIFGVINDIYISFALRYILLLMD